MLNKGVGERVREREKERTFRRDHMQNGFWWARMIYQTKNREKKNRIGIKIKTGAQNNNNNGSGARIK